MRVRIGDQWHDSQLEPICIQVSESEQAQVGSMDRGVAPQGKYAVFPEGWTVEQCREWMDEDEPADSDT
jgi:DNA gyrase inhibitor GyrI